MGGYCQSFKRKSLLFDSCVHTVPGLGKGGFLYFLMEQLGLEDKFTPIKYDEMFTVKFPEFEFSFPENLNVAKEKFISDFPEEKDNILRFFKDIIELYDEIEKPRFKKDWDPTNLPGMKFFKPFLNLSFGELIDNYFKDPKLRIIFQSIWPLGSVTPYNLSSIYSLLIIATKFLNGAYSVEGGFSVITELLKEKIISTGGKVLTNNKVVKINISDKKITSLITEKGDEYKGDIFISNTAPLELYHEMIGKEHLPRYLKRQLKILKPAISGFTLYFESEKTELYKDQKPMTFYYKNSDFVSLFDKNDDNLFDYFLIFKHPHSQGERNPYTTFTFMRHDYVSNWKEEKERWGKNARSKKNRKKHI